MFGKKKSSLEKSQTKLRMNRVRVATGLLASGLCIPAFGQSVRFPTYEVGPQPNGSYVVSNGTIINPAGKQVNLGIQVRAKAIALNPNTKTNSAAVLTLGASAAVQVFNIKTGEVLQTYIVDGTDGSGSYTGITYTPDGKYLLFSQDSSHVTVASVDKTTGLLSDYAHVSVPVAGTAIKLPLVGNSDQLNTVTCFSNSVPGTTGSAAIPCGDTYSFGTSYPAGIAISPNGKTAYAVLDVNNTLTKIDLTAATPVQGTQIRVGNVPHSVIISADGKTAYVSNEAGRIATVSDFQLYSDGVPVVAANPRGNTSTGTISVVDLASFTVTGSISTGLHPTGMAWYGKQLLVTNTYDDTISVIDPTTEKEVRKIDLALPISVPDQLTPAYGAGPNSIAVDATNNIAYVALYNANSVAVVDLTEAAASPIIGLIPVGYAPASVVLDSANNTLLVANDKGIGARNSLGSAYGLEGYNTHQDNGTVSIVKVPSSEKLAKMTTQVFENNHWDLSENIASAAGGSKHVKATAIPANIGDPSLIKHVFLIIRENRTYDQILGDVSAGNGDPSLAYFGCYASAPTYMGGCVTPNAHNLVQRFPLLDNFYDPSRQSADGHNWIVQAMAPYADDIQSPDWVRDYPSNGGDAIAYSKTGNIYNLAVKAGLKIKNYGEYVEYNTFSTPTGSTTEPSWTQFYNDTLAYESGAEKQLYYYNTVASHSPLPDVINTTVQNYPQFDLGIPDQFRVDVWKQDFAKDVAAGTVPQLTILWISSDHTGGPPASYAMQADNDLALGRFVDIISNSSVWSSSAIFVEEDDAQAGVDHVDGHRSPGYVISPYVKQDGFVDHTTYTQVNMTRTIEQILGLTPMNQFDLWASPMKTLFINNPPKENFEPWLHVANDIPLCYGVSGYMDNNGNVCSSEIQSAKLSPKARALQVGWMKMKQRMFAGKYHIPDSEDADTVNHLNWYETTNFVKPYPGESKVRPASDFRHRVAPKGDDDDK